MERVITNINAPATHQLTPHFPLHHVFMKLRRPCNGCNQIFVFFSVFKRRWRSVIADFWPLLSCLVLSCGVVGMERKKMGISILFWVFSVSHFCLATSRNLAEVEGQKSYNSHEQNVWSSPNNTHDRPLCQTPSSPAGTGGIHHPPPPTSGGGAIHHSPPPTPFHGGSGGSSGGICNCNTPPSVTPSSPSFPTNPPTPTTPISLSPPFTLSPPLPSSPPLIPDPNVPPFPCNYWFTHPTAIWVLFGYWGTIGQVFGTPPVTGIPFGRNFSLLQALGNTREDGFGALLREGTASLLNSMATKSFAFNAQEVRDAFNAAVSSEKTAAAQGKVFQSANEGHLKL